MKNSKILKTILISLIGTFCSGIVSCNNSTETGSAYADLTKAYNELEYQQIYRNEYINYTKEPEQVKEPVPFENYSKWKTDLDLKCELDVLTNELSIKEDAFYTIHYTLHSEYFDSALTRKQYKECSAGFFDIPERFVYFTSSDESIILVDSDGNLFPKSVGTATVTVHYGTQYKDINITVTEKDKYNDLTNYESAVNATYCYEDLNNSKGRELMCAQTKGNLNLLILPIYLTDSDKCVKEEEKEKIRQNINNVFFGEKNEYGWNSVKSYYATESDNKININGTVSPWYLDNHDSTYFEDDPDFRIHEVVDKAIDWFFKTTGEQKENYDLNNNKYFDGVVSIFCNDGNSSFYERVNFESYHKDIEGKEIIHGPVMISGIYSFLEIAATSHYSALTFIHEMGHIFGLSDYYDYSRQKFPVAGMSMQCWNDAGHDPYSCFALGWAKAIVPNASTKIKLNDFQSKHTALILYPENNKTEYSPFDEYIIVELYTPTKLNFFNFYYWEQEKKGPQLPCIRVWHVDSRLADLSTGSLQFSTNPLIGDVDLAMNNHTDYAIACRAGKEYQKYSLLYDVRNDVKFELVEQEECETFCYKNAFKKGDSFSLNKYKTQFINNGKMNSGLDLNWEFSIEDIVIEEDGYAAILDVKRI